MRNPKARLLWQALPNFGLRYSAFFRISGFPPGLWCNSSISPCEGDGPGANPGFLTNFDGPNVAGYRSKPKGRLLTVREPPGISPASRVRVPLAKPQVCDITCPLKTRRIARASAHD